MPRDFQLKAVFERVFAFDIGFVEEYVFYRCSEDVGNPKRRFQRGWVLAALDRVDRLSAHTDVLRQFFLRHLAMMESKLPNCVSKGHGSPRVPKSNKSDDMSKILDIATRIFDH